MSHGRLDLETLSIIHATTRAEFDDPEEQPQPCGGCSEEVDPDFDPDRIEINGVFFHGPSCRSAALFISADENERRNLAMLLAACELLSAVGDIPTLEAFECEYARADGKLYDLDELRQIAQGFADLLAPPKGIPPSWARRVRSLASSFVPQVYQEVMRP